VYGFFFVPYHAGKKRFSKGIFLQLGEVIFYLTKVALSGSKIGVAFGLRCRVILHELYQ
jgi:hypothetical protein